MIRTNTHRCVGPEITSKTRPSRPIGVVLPPPLDKDSYTCQPSPRKLMQGGRMWLRMIPTGLGMSTRTTFGDQIETAHSLTFTLRLAGQDSLKLETGEVFENPRYASARGDQQKEISAHLNVRPASDERDPSHTNNMRYFAGSKGENYSPPFIHFEVSAPPD